MLNYYRRFLPNAAQVQAPLHDLKETNKKNQQIIWTATDAFQACKRQLAQATLLAHPRQNAKLSITTDASDKAIGGFIQQEDDGISTPLAFFSRKLSPTERKYATYDRELLAIHATIKHYRHLLEACSFSIYTDHKPITFAFQQKLDKCLTRQFRYLDLFS